MPSRSRARSNIPKPWTKPVPAVAADHKKYPAAMTQLTSNRSTSQPETSWKTAYVQKKDESITPSCAGERPSSSLSKGAATDRLPRSTKLMNAESASRISTRRMPRGICECSAEGVVGIGIARHSNHNAPHSQRGLALQYLSNEARKTNSQAVAGPRAT